MSADVVTPKTLEFEPGFEVVWHSNYWDHQSILCDAFPGGGSVIICSDFLFRTTYGLTDQLEIGISVPAKLHSFYLGMKYQLARTETYGVALFGGWNTFLENETVKKGELYNMAGVGSALSLFLT